MYPLNGGLLTASIIIEKLFLDDLEVTMTR